MVSFPFELVAEREREKQLILGAVDDFSHRGVSGSVRSGARVCGVADALPLGPGGGIHLLARVGWDACLRIVDPDQNRCQVSHVSL